LVDNGPSQVAHDSKNNQQINITMALLAITGCCIKISAIITYETLSCKEGK